MKTITGTFSGDGKIEIETSGFRGPECLEATKELNAALGEVTETKAKPEMSQAAAQKNSQSQGA